MGIRAIVTFRAKRPDRLRSKVEKRACNQEYTCTEDIQKDIPDLAGVRIALYFPGDREEIDRFIKSRFVVEKMKDSFPPQSPHVYKKQFSGYGAIHYRVRLHDDKLFDTQKRYAQAIIEIQVASVLMHSWAEVEHDLAYKPFSGELSLDEYAILDEINGLVLAGEIALERLQRAVKARVGEGGKLFINHYELAAYLYDFLRSRPGSIADEPSMGRADALLRFLQLANLDRAELLKQYMPTTVGDGEENDIAEQIARNILENKPELSELYAQAQREVSNRNPYNSSTRDMDISPEDRALGYFMSRWIVFDAALRAIVQNNPSRISGMKGHSAPSIPMTARSLTNNQETLRKVEAMTQLRADLHRGKVFGNETFIQAGKVVEEILKALRIEAPDEMRSFIEGALDRIMQQHASGDVDGKTEAHATVKNNSVEGSAMPYTPKKGS